LIINNLATRGRNWSQSLGSQPAGDLVINPAVGYLIFCQARSYLPSQRASQPLAGTKLYCLVTDAHRCK